MLLVPDGVVTVTVRDVLGARNGIVNVAVTFVSLTTTTLLTVTSSPDIFTEVAPVRCVPVSVTATLAGFPTVPCVPLEISITGVDARIVSFYRHIGIWAGH